MMAPLCPCRQLPGLHEPQRGFVTLVTSLVILMLSTFVVFGVSKAILMEQKITNNDGRAKQAFEAAEAGMNVALNYLNNDPDTNADGCIDSFFINDPDGIRDDNTMDIGSASVTVDFPDSPYPCPVMSAALNIVSTGFSDDRTAMRVITQTAQALDPLPNRPDNPLIVRGGVTINGSATVKNQEGFSTIWSGNDVVLSGSGSQTFVPDPNVNTGPNPYPSCIDVSETCATVSTSLNVGLGLDVIENDDTLGDLTPLQFFMNFFGTTPTNYIASMVTMRVPASSIGTIDEVTSEVIWVDADPTGPVDFGSITVGCTVHQSGAGRCPAANTRPSIIIIDDDVDFSGTPHIYGLLFVRGGADMGSNTSVYGAAVIEGDTVKTGGSLNIWYNGSLLEQTSLSGASAGGAGSWKDWD